MGETILTTTLGAATVALVARIIFDWLKGRNDRNGRVDPALIRKMCADVTWTREIHERFDGDGSPLWYVPRSWREDLEKLNTAATTTNDLLGKILEQLRSRPL